MAMTEQEKQEHKEARAEARKAAKEAARIEAERNQKPVKSITINIEWVRSRTWGWNPNAEACVEYQDGSFERVGGIKCSGCGYDKASTVIADIFNRFLKYKLYNSEALDAAWIAKHNYSDSEKPRPYGIYIRDAWRDYAGGIGASCYKAISEYIGGTWEHVASGKSFDCYKYTDKED